MCKVREQSDFGAVAGEIKAKKKKIIIIIIVVAKNTTIEICDVGSTQVGYRVKQGCREKSCLKGVCC